MQRTLSCLLFALVVMAPSLLKAQVQAISYSEPEREDGRRTNFEVIGKISGNYLVFKNNNSASAISIYDNGMHLLQRVPLAFMPERYINVDFVAYADYCYLIYEYQHKNIVHVSAVKLDGQAQKMGDRCDSFVDC